jgi:asparagine synthase (glutamine-hydrolysing)
MCGIAGVHAPLESPARLEKALESMVASLHHRGPDDRGYYSAGAFGMGITRLSIIDVQGGHQPISTEDEQVTVVCNGEIYNHAELRERLRQVGHVFRTGSDIEVIAHLYEDLGLAFVEPLRGMFAIALWDQRRRRLVLVRDRLGIKPLFYAVAADRLFFASELKALRESGLLSLTVDPVAIDRYFTFGYVPAPLSIYREVRKLPAGNLLVWEDGKARIEPYWQLRFEPDRQRDEQDFAERFLELFRDAVGSHLMSDVPLGAFLSGGIDSSLMVSMMVECSTEPIRTFTMGFGESAGKDFDERPLARMLAGRYGTVQMEYEVHPRVEEVLDHVVDAFDEPFADDSVIPSYYLCNLAKRHVTVALTGLGGDELFGGYERYLALKLSRTYERCPRLFRKHLINPLVERLPERRNGHYTVNHVKRFIRSAGMSPGGRYLEYLTVFGDSMKRRLLNREAFGGLTADSPSSDFTKRFNDAPAETLLDRAFYSDFRTHLPDDILALTDRLSMAQGLEVRVPYLDHRLVEFCATIPSALKIRHWTKKYLLRRVARDFLPDAILTHRKQGFASPMAAWLRADLKPFLLDTLADKRLARHGLFRPAEVQALIRAHFGRQESNDRQLFALVMFQKWSERFM